MNRQTGVGIRAIGEYLFSYSFVGNECIERQDINTKLNEQYQ